MHPIPTQGAAGLAALSGSEALAILPEALTRVSAGDSIDVVPHDLFYDRPCTDRFLLQNRAIPERTPASLIL